MCVRSVGSTTKKKRFGWLFEWHECGRTLGGGVTITTFAGQHQEQ